MTRTYYYARSSPHAVAGISDVTPFGMAVPPIGAWEFFRGSRGVRGEQNPSSTLPAWGTTLGLAAIIGAGVLGYFVYRNLLVSKSTITGAYHGMMGSEE